jgi:CubicO group peptidase (beta-lactamase class C family)
LRKGGILPDFQATKLPAGWRYTTGKTITIRHLLHHTSGLRDQWNLLALAGWRLEDVITEQDILDLIWRQTALNFTPGNQYLYSNTGYTLLGLIVKRVSGMPLSQFARERIF